MTGVRFPPATDFSFLPLYPDQTAIHTAFKRNRYWVLGLKHPWGESNTHLHLVSTLTIYSTLPYTFKEYKFITSLRTGKVVKRNVCKPWLTWLQPTKNRSTSSACSCCGTTVRSAGRYRPTPGSCWLSLRPLRGRGYVATTRQQQPAGRQFVWRAGRVRGPLHSAARAKTGGTPTFGNQQHWRRNCRILGWLRNNTFKEIRVKNTFLAVKYLNINLTDQLFR